MCDVCDLLASDKVIATDETMAIIVPDTAAGMIIVAPRQHGPLAEQPPAVQTQLFATANQLSTVLFEELGFAGTNIIGHDDEHGRYAVVGRSENDGVELRWDAKRVPQSELASIAGRVTDELWAVGKEQPAKADTKAQPHEQSRPQEVLPDEDEETRLDPRNVAQHLQEHKAKGPKEEKNYLIKQLTRRR